MNKNELYWVANYTDKSKLIQYDDEHNKENKYADIDRDKLVRFDLHNTATGKAIYSVFLREGQQLVYRRRSIIDLTHGGTTIVFLVGWQMTIMTNTGPRNMVVLNYIHEDGSIALDGARNNLELLPEEA